MINYNNRDLIGVFFRLAGSVMFTRFVIVPATVSSVLCVLVICQPNARRYAGSSKTVAVIYATIIGFVIVFRTNMAFGRFFGGITHIVSMFSKWRDAFVAIVVFIETSILKYQENMKAEGANVEKCLQDIEDLRLAKARLMHWFSLLSAVAIQSIQHGRDEEVGFVSELLENGAQKLVPENRLHHPHASTPPNHVPEDTGPQPWTNQAGRVQLLGQLTPQELEQLACVKETVNLVMMWILLELSELSISGLLLTEPPILTRVYQELSNGMLSYFRAMQIEAVPFPFPFAQVINYTLYGFFLFCPFIVMEIVNGLGSRGYMRPDQMWPAVVLNFCACSAVAALNEISIELEDPFGDDMNDYPIAAQQWTVNWAIEDLYFSAVPVDYDPGAKAQPPPGPCVRVSQRVSTNRAPAPAPSAQELASKQPATPAPATSSAASSTASGTTPGESASAGALKDRAAQALQGASLRELRAAVEAFTEELSIQGMERRSVLGSVQGRLAGLVASLEYCLYQQRSVMEQHASGDEAVAAEEVLQGRAPPEPPPADSSRRHGALRQMSRAASRSGVEYC